VIAKGTCDELKELAKIEEKISVEVLDLKENLIEKMKTISNVDEIAYDGNSLLVTYKKGKNNLVSLIEYLKDEKIEYSKIYSQRPTLNDVFLELTGKELRD
jgi:ABC-2 type transport system ATP-binding protein